MYCMVHRISQLLSGLVITLLSHHFHFIIELFVWFQILTVFLNKTNKISSIVTTAAFNMVYSWEYDNCGDIFLVSPWLHCHFTSLELLVDWCKQWHGMASGNHIFVLTNSLVQDWTTPDDSCSGHTLLLNKYAIGWYHFSAVLWLVKECF
jgi:hypothetical protein